MTATEIAVALAVVVALALWVAWVNASRLDRLHRKVASARSVVEAQLVRRATVAAELATSGLVDPVSSVVLGASAWQALAAATSQTPPELRALLDDPVETGTEAPDRARTESELTATLAEVLSDPAEVAELRAEPVGAELLDALAAAWYRVQLARRFHNEAVAQAQRARSGWVVRTFGLAGHAAWPAMLELDDAWPPTLEGYGRG